MRTRRLAVLTATGLAAGLVVAVPSAADTDAGVTWMAATGDVVIFSATDGSHGNEVWSSDLTGAGTQLIHDTDPSYQSDLEYLIRASSAGGPAYYAVDDDDIWRTDGTDAGTEFVFEAADLDGMRAVPGGVALVDDQDLFFIADGSTTALDLDLANDADDSLELLHGGEFLFQLVTDEVWASDGTVAGSRQLGTASGSIDGSAPGATKTYVWSDEDVWVTDGTAGDFAAINGSVDAYATTALLGDRLLVSADTGDGYEPSVIDGATLTQLKNIAPGGADSESTGFAKIGEVVVFVATPDGGSVNELWRTDGTPAGTQKLTNITGDVTNGPWVAASTGDFAVIRASGGSDPIVVTDGTLAGTFETAQSVSDAPDPIQPIAIGDQIAFLAQDSDHSGAELWVSDGTPAGTHEVTEVHPGPSVDDVLVADTEVYFTADTPTHGPSVWRIDRADPLGSAPALVYVGNLSQDGLITMAGDDLLFEASSGLQQYDHSADAVLPVTDGSGSSWDSWTRADDGIYFTKYPDTSLYRIELDAGPWSVAERLTPADDIEMMFGFLSDGAGLGPDLVFVADDDTTSGVDRAAFHYDESTDTLTRLTAAIDVGGARNFITDAGVGVTYFEADGMTGDEIWRTQGTPGTTEQISKAAGIENQAMSLTWNGTLVFSADGLGPLDVPAGPDANAQDGHSDIYALVDPSGTPNLERWTDLVGEYPAWADPSFDTSVPVVSNAELGALAIVYDNDATPKAYQIMYVDRNGPDTMYDLTTRPEGSQPDDLTLLPPTGAGTPVAFTAVGDGVGREAWVFRPGTRTLSMIDESRPGELGSVPTALTAGSLWFAASSEAGAHDLWYQAGPADTPVNVTAPTAADDAATTLEDEAVVLDLTVNDEPRVGPDVTLDWAGSAANGSVVANLGNGTATYTPAPGFFGVDTFTYRISDDMGVAQAVATVTVEEVPAPNAVDDNATTEENTAVTVAVLANDSKDASAPGPLTLTAVSAPSNGTATVADSQVTYTPDAWFSGTDTFVYDVSDGHDTSTATVRVTVSEADAAVERVQGDSRAETAVAVAGVSHSGGADTVLLARQDAYPDALAGAPLARALDAPILLTRKDELLDVVAAAITDLGASRVVLLGGEGAVTADVAAAVADLPGVTNVDRIGGASRFATSALIAAELPGSPTAAYVTEGSNADPSRGWPDALSVSPLAASSGTPILLVTRDVLPDDTATALADLGITDATIVGGEAAVSPAVGDAITAAGVTLAPRLSGPSRYATSVAVAEAAVAAGAHPGLVWFATGLNFPDALVAGPAVAVDGGVMMLVHGREADRSPESIGWLDTHASDPIERVRILGGAGAVTPEVEAAINAKLA